MTNQWTCVDCGGTLPPNSPLVVCESCLDAQLDGLANTQRAIELTKEQMVLPTTFRVDDCAKVTFTARNGVWYPEEAYKDCDPLPWEEVEADNSCADCFDPIPISDTLCVPCQAARPIYQDGDPFPIKNRGGYRKIQEHESYIEYEPTEQDGALVWILWSSLAIVAATICIALYCIWRYYHA